MVILRLSLAAYKLGRAIIVDGVCSVLLWATSSITAGLVHAASELRVLLIQRLDETAARHRIVTLMVYVDDTGVEAAGPDLAVKRAVIGATKYFTRCAENMGMEVSTIKNGCVASSTQLAQYIINDLLNLKAKVQLRAKSLGGALGAGRRRNTKVQQQRLTAFKVRKVHF